MDPKVTQKLEEDVSFVRQAVEQRDEDQYRTLGITVLWAVIIAVGYTLNDFAVEYSPLFWTIAPVAGFLVSCGLGAWQGRKQGVRMSGLGRRHALHWGTIFFAVVAVTSIALSHRIDGRVIGQLFASSPVWCSFWAGCTWTGAPSGRGSCSSADRSRSTTSSPTPGPWSGGPLPSV